MPRFRRNGPGCNDDLTSRLCNMTIADSKYNATSCNATVKDVRYFL
jgi:hypothetical protein